ncbi:hypothetical protein POM88_044423 [Heracleum sosnowskyi]|uniref:Uncharacterized protein n=1 Tax=Heracleum sosnowskyi TaxID=360622 RepID=A0AAD8H3U4_9APIA|nr:hypothetical protein POM88_044423 [Heracleum sosnowskyi]
MQEHAAASLLTLSVSSVNKPTISTSGTIPLLVNILRYGSPQAKVDAVMALYNLSTLPDNLNLILQAEPVPSIVHFLKTCKKLSTYRCRLVVYKSKRKQNCNQPSKKKW